jgi:hypothetical protein
MVTTITNTHLPPQILHFSPQEIGLNITGPAICHGNVAIQPDSTSDTKQIEWPEAAALQRVSQELDFRIDICRVTKGAHIEHL